MSKRKLAKDNDSSFLEPSHTPPQYAQEVNRRHREAKGKMASSDTNPRMAGVPRKLDLRAINLRKLNDAINGLDEACRDLQHSADGLVAQYNASMTISGNSEAVLAADIYDLVRALVKNPKRHILQEKIAHLWKKVDHD